MDRAPVDEQGQARFIPACPLLVHRPYLQSKTVWIKGTSHPYQISKRWSLMAHVALPELHCWLLFCATPFATESYRHRLVGRVSIMPGFLQTPQIEMQRLLRHFQATQSCFLHSRFGRLPEYQYFILHPSAVCQCGNTVWSLNPTVSGRAYVKCELWSPLKPKGNTMLFFLEEKVTGFTVLPEDKWRQQRVEFARGHWSRSTSSWSL